MIKVDWHDVIDPDEVGLPDIPQEGTYDDGYDWMEQLGPAWEVLPEVGEWPYHCVAVYRSTLPIFGIVEYLEGDITLRRFDSHAEFAAALRKIPCLTDEVEEASP